MNTMVTVQALLLCLQIIGLIYAVDMCHKSKKNRKGILDLLTKHNELATKMRQAFKSNDLTLHKEIQEEIKQLLEAGKERL